MEIRKTFAEILAEDKIDLTREYKRIIDQFYDTPFNPYGTTWHSWCEVNFNSFPYKKRCVSLDDFDETFGFDFYGYPYAVDLDQLLTLCEYVFNLVFYLTKDSDHFLRAKSILDLVMNTAEAVKHTPVVVDELTVFIPNNAPSIVIAESVGGNLASKILYYNHRSLVNNLEEKKKILISIAYDLEGKQKQLHSINQSFKSDLFLLFNSLDIRHNNVDEESTKYNEKVARMTPEQLEQWYDRIYNLSLQAYLLLDDPDAKKEITEFRQKKD